MMPNGNPFFVDPTAGYDPQALTGLADVLKSNREKREALERQGLVRAEVSEAVNSGDPGRVADVAIKYPEYQRAIKTAFDFTNAETEKLSDEAYRKAILDPDNALEHIQTGIQQVEGAGGRPDIMKRDVALLESNPDAAIQAMKVGYASINPEGYKALMAEKAPEFQMGTGAMAGYVFNPADGTFSIQPEIKGKLMADADIKSKKEGKLDTKDIVSINDKITALTKDARGIHTAAADLDALKQRSTAASKLAAVFKFMKALDPTSVVRETEQGMVYAAQGAASQLAGKINSLMGEGALTEAGFQDVVDTSKALANSAVAASSGEVDTYLSVLDDKIGERDIARLKSRVPKAFEIKPTTPPPTTTPPTTTPPTTTPPTTTPQADVPLTNAKGWGLMVDDQGNRAYVGPNGEIEEVK